MDVGLNDIYTRAHVALRRVYAFSLRPLVILLKTRSFRDGPDLLCQQLRSHEVVFRSYTDLDLGSS